MDEAQMDLQGSDAIETGRYARPKTRERILQASLQLFNERGERTVTTNHIAAALGISPGNLYYHFRNKTEIILELLSRYQARMLSVLNVPEDRPLTALDKLEYFRALSGQLWDFRFIHRDIHHLMDLDEQIRERYPDFASQVMQQGRRIYTQFVGAGLMRMTAHEIECLIVNVWILLSNWTSYLYISGQLRRDEPLNQEFINQALQQLAFLEGPYLTAQGRSVYAMLEKNFPEQQWALSAVQSD
jgi:AcrR family transcriptional regulator